MSPYIWNGSNANVFRVNSDGHLNWDNVHGTWGVRPISFYNLNIWLRLNIKN